MLKDSLTHPLRGGWVKNAPSARHISTTGGLMMSYKVTGLRSWNINAEDFEAMVRFYRDILGAEETRHPQVAGANVERLKLGSTGLGLFDAKEGPRPGVPHHTFDFEGPQEPDAMVRELEAKGIKVENIRMHGNGPGYSVYVYDPCGNRIELSTDPA
jgi:catechol 2,3-dioxygenase-like lactoylglutathione lyase family enzyme